jgi:hypothetical protein
VGDHTELWIYLLLELIGGGHRGGSGKTCVSASGKPRLHALGLAVARASELSLTARKARSERNRIYPLAWHWAPALGAGNVSFDSGVLTRAEGRMRQSGATQRSLISRARHMGDFRALSQQDTALTAWAEGPAWVGNLRFSLSCRQPGWQVVRVGLISTLCSINARMHGQWLRQERKHRPCRLTRALSSTPLKECLRCKLHMR